mmetsp:Transcript_52160/g.144479  ORF Transcript_52160/g.144479 Transcript_52160/m.144479 type:complete len:133 (+) Transcript_52160:728-1126(+)
MVARDAAVNAELLTVSDVASAQSDANTAAIKATAEAAALPESTAPASRFLVTLVGDQLTLETAAAAVGSTGVPPPGGDDGEGGGDGGEGGEEVEEGGGEGGGKGWGEGEGGGDEEAGMAQVVPSHVQPCLAP